jgi:hypothetical protein
VIASSNETPCLARFVAAFRASHSKVRGMSRKCRGCRALSEPKFSCKRSTNDSRDLTAKTPDARRST